MTLLLLGVVALVAGVAVVPVVSTAGLAGLPAARALDREHRPWPTYTYSAPASASLTSMSFTVTPSNGVQPSGDHVRVKYAMDSGWTICTRTSGTTTWTCPRAVSALSGELSRVAAP